PVRNVLRGPSLHGLALRGEVVDVEAVRGGVGATVLIEGVPRLEHRVRVVRWVRIVREPPEEPEGHVVRVRVHFRDDVVEGHRSGVDDDLPGRTELLDVVAPGARRGQVPTAGGWGAGCQLEPP